MRASLIWAALALAVLGPVAVAAGSPLLQWRDPAYVAAGFAGIAALGLLLVQPLLIVGRLPGLAGARGRRVHRATGAALLGAVLLHVAGLWVTSPPDVIDVFLLRSPTPFGIWGLAAFWAVILAAAFATFRRRIGPRRWRPAHAALAAVTAVGTVLHAVLIEGTMGPLSKYALCALVVLATAWALARVWPPRRR